MYKIAALPQMRGFGRCGFLLVLGYNTRGWYAFFQEGLPME